MGSTNSNQTKSQLQVHVTDPNSQEIKNLIKTSFNSDYLTALQCLKNDFKVAPVKQIHAILHCLYQHFVGWKMLNTQVNGHSEY